MPIPGPSEFRGVDGSRWRVSSSALRSIRAFSIAQTDELIRPPGVDVRFTGWRSACAKRLQFTTDIAAAVGHGTMQFIGLAAPPGEDGSAAMRHVLAAAAGIGHHIADRKFIVDLSTVPVGTATRVRAASVPRSPPSSWRAGWRWILRRQARLRRSRRPPAHPGIARGTVGPTHRCSSAPASSRRRLSRRWA